MCRPSSTDPTLSPRWGCFASAIEPQAPQVGIGAVGGFDPAAVGCLKGCGKTPRPYIKHLLKMDILQLSQMVGVARNWLLAFRSGLRDVII